MAAKSVASRTSERLDDHLQRHADVTDPLINRNTILLVGEKGDNGLCASMKALIATVDIIDKRTQDMLSWAKAVGIAAILAAGGYVAQVVLSHGSQLVK